MLKSDSYILDFMLHNKSVHAEPLFNKHLAIKFNSDTKYFLIFWSNPPSHDFKYLTDLTIFKIAEDISLFSILPWSDQIDWYPSLPECWIWLYALESFASHFEIQNLCIECINNNPLFINNKILDDLENHSLAFLIEPSVKTRILTPYSNKVLSQNKSQVFDWIRDLVC